MYFEQFETTGIMVFFRFLPILTNFRQSRSEDFSRRLATLSKCETRAAWIVHILGFLMDLRLNRCEDLS